MSNNPSEKNLAIIQSFSSFELNHRLSVELWYVQIDNIKQYIRTVLFNFSLHRFTHCCSQSSTDTPLLAFSTIWWKGRLNKVMLFSFLADVWSPDAHPHRERESELLPRLCVMTFLGYLTKLQAHKPTHICAHMYTVKAHHIRTDIIKYKFKCCTLQARWFGGMRFFKH